MKRLQRNILYKCIGGVGLIALISISAPPDFPRDEVVRIEEGSAREVAGTLATHNVVRSSTLFHSLAYLLGVSDELQAGNYRMTDPKNVFHILYRLARGEHGQNYITVRFVEGATRQSMAEKLAATYPDFDTEKFLTITAGKEGMLFPDTYFLLPDATPEDVAELLLKTFERKTAVLSDDIASSTHTLREIVTMASIIEREVADSADQKIVSGILWKRLSINMPLQVDAPLYFLLGKTSAELTGEDLELDSPYNTYVHQGLPPGPIGNPSLSALEAALNPAETEYLYYLSDAEGMTHYAQDFETHVENKRLHLN